MEIINLDMTPSTVTPNAHAGQYDSARTVRFMLKNGGTPYTLAGTENITAEITRSDNTEVTVNVANTSSNYVDVVFDDTVCTVKGLYACELRLVDGGVDIGSKNFALLVQRDPYDGAGVHVETVGPADICTFETNLAEPLQSLTVNVVATGGNGTPDNPNPINGYSSANINANGITHTIAFGQMVFGGKLDVTRGKLTVNHVKTILDKNVKITQGAYGMNFKCSLLTGAKASVQSVLSGTLSDKLLEVKQTDAWGIDYTFLRIENSPTEIYFNLNSSITTIEDCLTFLESNPIEFVYELDTPFDIDLTPEVISAIVGTNNVFADCGQSTVKYLKAGG